MTITRAASYSFGVGNLYFLPSDGSTPLTMATVQDVSLNFDAEMKELRGRYQLALANARGAMKVSGKIAAAEFNPDVFNEVYFGQSSAAGQRLQAQDEAHSVPDTPGPYTVNATNRGASGVNWIADLGVYSANSGLPYVKNATGTPAAVGEYGVSALGVYTFHSGAAKKTVLLNYMYADPSTGKIVTITNQLMGQKPNSRLIMSQNFEGGWVVADLYNVAFSKLSIPFKNDDFTQFDLEYSAFCDATNTLGTIATSYVTAS